MTPDFWIGLLLGAVALSAIGGILLINRRRPGDLWEWSEEAYQPRNDQPRAITRITSRDIDWEINP